MGAESSGERVQSLGKTAWQGRSQGNKHPNLPLLPLPQFPAGHPIGWLQWTPKSRIPRDIVRKGWPSGARAGWGGEIWGAMGNIQSERTFFKLWKVAFLFIVFCVHWGVKWLPHSLGSTSKSDIRKGSPMQKCFVRLTQHFCKQTN